MHDAGRNRKKCIMNIHMGINHFRSVYQLAHWIVGYKRQRISHFGYFWHKLFTTDHISFTDNRQRN